MRTDEPEIVNDRKSMIQRHVSREQDVEARHRSQSPYSPLGQSVKKQVTFHQDDSFGQSHEALKYGKQNSEAYGNTGATRNTSNYGYS